MYYVKDNICGTTKLCFQYSTTIYTHSLIHSLPHSLPRSLPRSLPPLSSSLSHSLFPFPSLSQVTGANSTHLFLSLHISNLFNVSLPLVPSPVTANEAIDKIISSAKDNDNKLDFKIELAPGVTETPTLVIIRNESALVYHAPGRDTEESTTGSESGLSDGAIAGIAVWMLILGLGVGIVGTMCVFAALSRTRGKAFFTSKGSKASSVSYKRHVVVSTT